MKTGLFDKNGVEVEVGDKIKAFPYKCLNDDCDHTCPRTVVMRHVIHQANGVSSFRVAELKKDGTEDLGYNGEGFNFHPGYEVIKG